MAIEQINITDFINLAHSYLVVDVRSPQEYQHAHIPGAVSVPLFSDEERAVVGTTYKQQSREKAIKVGLDFYGPKMKLILNEVENALKARKQQTVLVHCWRGGMRSAAIAWLLDLYGFKVYTLEGGYKRFRNWALKQFEKKYSLELLGGFTGSGKTEILHQLEEEGYAVIDLEGMAHHKGSTFGNLEHFPQDSTEHFENRLALKLYQISQKQYKSPKIWVESESSRIGHIRVPHRFFEQMQVADRINIEVPFEIRLKHILEDYGKYPKEELIAGTQRIKKRLGGLRMQQTIDFIEKGDLESAFSILLNYYDKAYFKSRSKFKEASKTISLPGKDAAINVEIILREIQQTV